jgi:ribosomal-protein-alanine N-acetyltransferase
MLEQLSNLHKICFGTKGWSESDILDLKKSGCDVIGSENAMLIYRVLPDEAEIITIAVHPDVRRSGLASALIAIMEKDLKEKNVNRVLLEVAANNLSARGLYEKLGFKQISVRPKYYDGVDGLLMEKIL